MKQQSFKGKWKDLLVFMERNDKMEWKYVPPRWLFPPYVEVGFNFDIRGGDILPATKMYHYRFVFPYCIGNGNYGVVLHVIRV